MADVRIHPVNTARFDDLVDLFGTRGDPSWCWCQYFLTTGSSYTESTERNRAALREQVGSSAHTVGLIAYAAGHGSEGAAGTAVGWVQLGPRPGFDRIIANRAMQRVVPDLADESVWAVTCFVVRVGHRRNGIGRALLTAAVDEARRNGATALVGHPVDVSARSGRVAGGDLYHGAASTFESVGFEIVGRTAPTRPVMRLDL